MHPVAQRVWSFLKKLILGTGGQVGVSAANLALSLLLVTRISPEEYGTFAFIQILIFFGFSLSNALLSTPLMADLHRHNKPFEETVASFFLANVVLGLLMAIAVMAMAIVLFSQPVLTGALFGLSAFLLFVGRLFRSYLLDHQKSSRVLISDYTYTLVLLAGCGASLFWEAMSIKSATLLLALGAGLSLAAMGFDMLKIQLRSVIHGKRSAFFDGVRNHGRHALTGVIMAELVSRGHSYIVTFWLGPSAFAPLAVAGLFFRPALLVVMSLTQFEMARLARLLKDVRTKEAWIQLRFFYTALGIVWVSNVLLVAAVLMFFFHDLLGDKYEFHDIALAVSLHAILTAFVCVRGPASALLQANANFAPLSRTTIIAALVTLPTVLLCVWQFGAIWSLVGVALGELVSATLVFRLALRKIPRT